VAQPKRSGGFGYKKIFKLLLAVVHISVHDTCKWCDNKNYTLVYIGNIIKYYIHSDEHK